MTAQEFNYATIVVLGMLQNPNHHNSVAVHFAKALQVELHM